jgi:hypothetical protein
MERPDAAIIASIKTEMVSDFAQIGILGRKDAAIGESNMEQTAEKIFEYRLIIGKQTADLAGVAFEPGGAFSGEVEDQPDMLFFARRDLEYFTKGGDLVAGDDAVGSGHLGAKGDDRDGEGDAAARIVVRASGGIMRLPTGDVARCPGEQCPERTTERQVAGAGDDATNKAHGV